MKRYLSYVIVLVLVLAQGVSVWGFTNGGGSNSGAGSTGGGDFITVGWRASLVRLKI